MPEAGRQLVAEWYRRDATSRWTVATRADTPAALAKGWVPARQSDGGISQDSVSSATLECGSTVDLAREMSQR